MVAGVLLLTLSAKTQIPWQPVPMTMQTYVILVVAMSYGTRLAGATVAAYLALGALAIRYGDSALDLMRTRGRVIAIWVAVIIVAAALGWWLLKRLSRARS